MENTKELQLTKTHEIAMDLTELTQEVITNSKTWIKKRKKWILAVGVIAISFSTITPIVAKLREPEILTSEDLTHPPIIGEYPPIDNEVLPPVIEEVPPVVNDSIITTKPQLDIFTKFYIEQKVVESKSFMTLDELVTTRLEKLNNDFLEQAGIQVEVTKAIPENVEMFYEFKKTISEDIFTKAQYEFALTLRTTDSSLESNGEIMTISSLDEIEASDADKANKDNQIAIEWFQTLNDKYSTEQLLEWSTDFFIDISEMSMDKSNLSLMFDSTIEYIMRPSVDFENKYTFYVVVLSTYNGSIVTSEFIVINPLSTK